MSDLTGKRVLVTGHTEFLGRHIYRTLRKFGPEAVWCCQRGELDDGSHAALVELLADAQPEIVIHLCELNIGIDRSHAGNHPGSGFHIDGRDFFAAIRAANVQKCIVVGSSLAYPPVETIPWREAEFSRGTQAVADSKAALAQREFLLQGLVESEQQTLPVVTLLLGELFGPGEESRRQTGSMVELLLRKTLAAREADREELHLQGSGAQSRDFLFVRDAAEAIALASDRPSATQPLNIGTGIETTMGSLVELMAAGFGYEGKVVWSEKLLAGVSRQCLDCRRADATLGFAANTGLEAGIRETIGWHERQWNRSTAIAN